MNEEKLAKVIPKTVKEFRFANGIVKITKTNGKPSGILIINTENKIKTHHHIYFNNDQAHFHETLEQKGTNIHRPIKYEKFLETLGKALQEMFSLARQVELTDQRFVGKTTILASNIEMYIEKSTNKKVEFGQMYDEDESVFENIDVVKNSVGSIWEKNEETHMVFVKNGLVYVIDLEELEEISVEMDSIMNPIENKVE